MNEIVFLYQDTERFSIQNNCTIRADAIFFLQRGYRERMSGCKLQAFKSWCEQNEKPMECGAEKEMVY